MALYMNCQADFSLNERKTALASKIINSRAYKLTVYSNVDPIYRNLVQWHDCNVHRYYPTNRERSALDMDHVAKLVFP